MFRAPLAHEIWAKGWFSVECHTLNILDDHSRFCVRSEPLPGETMDLALPVFFDAFEEYGLPFSLLCDNGNPWGCGLAGGFTKFEVYLMKLCVLVIHGRRLHPQTQGKMERFNRTEIAECFGLPQYDFSQYGFDEVRERIRIFLNFYNYDRPHESLAMDVPNEHFHSSERKYVRNMPVAEWEYPDGYTTRFVSKNGYFSFRGAPVRNGVLELARRGNEVQTPEDVFRDRYVLEFAGIRPRSHYTESQLHVALVNHLKMFMLELGKGFAWVASQYPISLNTKKPHHVDLVFYNYFLHCFVLIDLKRDRVEHYDVGQMNMYLNYFRSEEGTPADNPPIGIILAAENYELVVRFATQGITNRIFVSRYQLYLPDKEQLRRELAYALEAESRKAKKSKAAK